MSIDNDWMNKKDGIPHKNGYVRFYIIGFYDDAYGYLGWFDMTDWDKGWEKVWEAAIERNGNINDVGDFYVIRHDQMLTLQLNVTWALAEALVDNDETTEMWWYRKECEAEREAELKSKGETK